MRTGFEALWRAYESLEKHMNERFDRMDAKQDLADAKQNLAADRISDLELWKARVVGALAVLSFMSMTALAWLAFFAAQ